jgi:predicted ArsR family transcriptional regulator
LLFSKNKRQAEKTSGNGKTADNKQAIIEFITQKSIAKTAEIADAVGLSQPRVRVLLAELIAEGIIESQGEGKARAYILKE